MVQELSSQIRIVLVGTSHAGNIGAAARAMKTMGIVKLCLVQPSCFPSAEATARASGADDVLRNAVVYKTLKEALEGSDLVFGATSRKRKIDWPTVSPKRAAEMVSSSLGSTVALVFGSERNGLSNEELDLCQYGVTIETADDFHSLNLSHAVQILAYEIKQSYSDAVEISRAVSLRDKLATAEELTLAGEHCSSVMALVNYMDDKRPKLLNRRIRRFFSRSEARHSEIQIFRGFLAAIERRVRNNGEESS